MQIAYWQEGTNWHAGTRKVEGVFTQTAAEMAAKYAAAKDLDPDSVQFTILDASAPDPRTGTLMTDTPPEKTDSQIRRERLAASKASQPSVVQDILSELGVE